MEFQMVGFQNENSLITSTSKASAAKIKDRVLICYNLLGLRTVCPHCIFTGNEIHTGANPACLLGRQREEINEVTCIHITSAVL